MYAFEKEKKKKEKEKNRTGIRIIKTSKTSMYPIDFHISNEQVT